MIKINEIVYFCSEFELLEAHLDTHAPFVEKFFIVESEVTVSGIPKPLFFQENKERYSRFNVEHIIVPTELQPKTEGWPDFRVQDHIKNKYAHPIACEGADWVQHSDVDEIIKPKCYEEGIKVLESNPNWKHSCYQLRQSKTFVNTKQKKVNVYRFVKATPNQYEEGPKGTPRGEFGNVVGWHFHNCFSSVDELYWKVLNRNWFFTNEGETLPSREQCEYVLSRLGNIWKITTDEIPMIKQMWSFVCDVPDAMEKRARPITYLPQWMQDNIERFPYYESKSK